MKTQKETETHTPGPWEAADSGYILEANNRGTVIACINSVKRGPEDDKTKWGSEGEANGLLIAAAPDLLEAAKDMSDYHEVGGDLAELKNGLRNLRAAIAKAEGAR